MCDRAETELENDDAVSVETMGLLQDLSGFAAASAQRAVTAGLDRVSDNDLDDLGFACSAARERASCSPNFGRLAGADRAPSRSPGGSRSRAGPRLKGFEDRWGGSGRWSPPRSRGAGPPMVDAGPPDSQCRPPRPRNDRRARQRGQTPTGRCSPRGAALGGRFFAWRSKTTARGID